MRLPIDKNILKKRLLRGTTSLCGFKSSLALVAGVFAFSAGNTAQAQVVATDALPTNGVVLSGSGSASINYDGVNPILNVNQTTDNVVIDWDTFDVGTSSEVNFNQNSATSIAVNRIHDSDASQVLGDLNANGQVILLNQNGVFFGGSSVVDVAGLVVSTGTIDINDFNADGSVNLSDIDTGNSIENNGSISVADGGLAAFVAPHVVNNGVISANLGRVALAAGDTATVDLFGDDLVLFGLNSEIEGAIIDAGGNISANGGTLAMTTSAAQGVVDSVINMTGVAQATAVGFSGGKIILGGDNTDVNINGTINASGIDSNTTITADTVDIDSGATISLVAGDVSVTADQVDLGTDITTFGTISGDVDVVNVENDTAEIQDGVSMATSGGTVNVGAGTYYGPIEIDKAITISGVDRNTTFITTDFATQNAFTIDGNIGGGDITISNMHVHDAAHGIDVVNTTTNLHSLTIDNMNFHSNDRNGININGGRSATYSNAAGGANYIHITNSNFLNNAWNTTVPDQHGDIVIYGYGGNLLLQNLDIQSNSPVITDPRRGHTYIAADYGIHISGHQNFVRTMDSLEIDNVSISGNYRYSQLGIKAYYDMTNGIITFNDVVLGGLTDAGTESAALTGSLDMNGVGSYNDDYVVTVDIGNTQFLGGDLNYIYNAFGDNIDATGAIFDTVDNTVIESLIVHEVDNPVFNGLVTWTDRSVLADRNGTFRPNIIEVNTEQGNNLEQGIFLDETVTADDNGVRLEYTTSDFTTKLENGTLFLDTQSKKVKSSKIKFSGA